MASLNPEIISGEEETLDIPADGIKRRTGFTLDIGGSMAKLAYATDEGSVIRLHFVSFPCDNFSAIMSILREKFNGKLEEGTVVYTCGLGLLDWKKTLEVEFKIKIENLLETEVFVEGFKQITKMVSREKIFYPRSAKAKAWAENLLGEMNVMSKDMDERGAQTWDVFVTNESKKTTETGKNDPIENTNQINDSFQYVKYPVMLCMLGSGSACLKINEDGSHMFTEGSSRCGRMFVSLGKLLTGAKDYKELVDLASKGNSENVHTYGKHMKTDVEDDLYSKLPDSVTYYSYGNALYKDMDKSPFAPEDLAAACLDALAQDVSQMCHLAAMSHGVKSLFFCGGFVGLSQLVRERIAMYMELRDTANTLAMTTDHQFLRFGGYLGALGALLKTLGVE